MHLENRITSTFGQTIRGQHLANHVKRDKHHDASDSSGFTRIRTLSNSLSICTKLCGKHHIVFKANKG